MQTNSNPVLDSYQHQMDTTRAVAGVVFDVADRMEHLVLDATRSAFDERMRFYQALSDVRAPQDLLAFQAEFFSHTPERLLKVQKDWMQIATESQEKISEVVQHYHADLAGTGTAQSFAIDSNTATHTNSALTHIFSMWDNAFKEAVAMATSGMDSVSPRAQDEGDAVDVRRKAVQQKKARVK